MFIKNTFLLESDVDIMNSTKWTFYYNLKKMMTSL